MTPGSYDNFPFDDTAVGWTRVAERDAIVQLVEKAWAESVDDWDWVYPTEALIRTLLLIEHQLARLADAR
jgi:hypothetical protein